MQSGHTLRSIAELKKERGSLVLSVIGLPSNSKSPYVIVEENADGSVQALSLSNKYWDDAPVQMGPETLSESRGARFWLIDNGYAPERQRILKERFNLDVDPENLPN